MAVINKETFRSFITDFNEWKDALKKHVHKYKDPRKVFIQKMIKRIPFFEEVNSDSLLDIMYGLKE